MSNYTKLFSDIITSTIWRESHAVRIVWVTMLALRDRNHHVNASVPGLADVARVTIDECLEALKVLEGPDKWSRTQEFEGRRIAPIDGGWVLLNGEKYRKKMSQDDRREYLRIKQAERRKTLKLSKNSQQPVNEKQHSESSVTPTVRGVLSGEVEIGKFLAELESRGCYGHIDLRREVGRMEAWLSAHPGRQLTKKFVVNWLNRIEAPAKESIDQLLVRA